jgi:hypothetical protein
MRRFSGEFRARERDRRRAPSLERARLRELVAGRGGAPRVVGFGVAPDHPQAWAGYVPIAGGRECVGRHGQKAREW